LVDSRETAARIAGLSALTVVARRGFALFAAFAFPGGDSGRVPLHAANAVRT